MLDIVRPPDEAVGAIFTGRLRFRVINRCDDLLAVHGARNPLRQAQLSLAGLLCQSGRAFEAVVKPRKAK